MKYDTSLLKVLEIWNDTFEKVMMAVVISYFGSRGVEKSINVIKK